MEVVAWLHGRRSHLRHISMKADTKPSDAGFSRVRHAEIPQMVHINAGSALFISIPSAVSPFQERRRVMGNYVYAWSANLPKLLKKFIMKITATVLLTTVQMKMIPTCWTNRTEG
jgi:hypothetical protein